MALRTHPVSETPRAMPPVTPRPTRTPSPTRATVTTRRPPAAVTTNWTQGLPMLAGVGLTLRELRLSDAPALLALLTTEEVTRFISPPPTTREGFERFIAWTARERAAGRYLCFAVVPDGYATAVGLFQLRQLDPMFGTAEWGFALGSAFWGSGLFAAGAAVLVDFAFDVVGVHRLEARAAVQNGRGNGALRKIGAVQEARLRHSFVKGGTPIDQALWALLHEDWIRAKAVWGAKVN